MPVPKVDETAVFLAEWFAAALPGELVEIRPLNKRPGCRPLRRSFFRDAASAATFVARCVAHGDDVYLGALPRVREGGTADDVTSSRVWLWGDVDYGTVGHAAPGPYATRDEALAAIGAPGVPTPTFLIDTGGGFHVWWRLAVPVSHDVHGALLRRAAHAIQADVNALDPPRILRIPGTLNQKAAPPRPVVLVTSSAELLEASAFARFTVPDSPEFEPPEAPRPSSRAPVSGDRPFDRANDIPVAEVLAWLGVSMHREGHRVYCACPVHGGTNVSQMIVGGERNVASCFGDCAAGSGDGHPYTPVDLVSGVRHVEPREAVNALADSFGFQGFRRSGARVIQMPGTQPAEPARPKEPWEEGLRLDANGNVTKDPGNAAILLRNLTKWRGVLAYDEFADSLQWISSPPSVDGFDTPSPGEVRDHHILFVQHWLTKRYRVSFSKDAVFDAVVAAARANTVNPLRAYLDALVWDEKERLGDWLATYLGAECTPYAQAVGQWWMISAVARALQPGCQADHLIILEGPQGAGKSSAVRILGGQWYLGSLPDVRNKDAADALNGHWIVEIGELDAFKGSGGPRVKDFITQPTDVYRAAYARFKARHPRTSVFIGTTNDASYLRDATGARRFWPVSVRRVERDALVRDRDQLWAEAVHLYRGGAQWWPTDELAEDVELEQAKRFDVDPWEDTVGSKLAAWLAKAAQDDRLGLGVPGGTDLTTSTILGSWLGLSSRDQDMKAMWRVGAIMKRLGYRNCLKRRGEARAKVWVVQSERKQDGELG